MSSTYTVPEILADVSSRCNVPAFTTTTRVTLGRATFWVAMAARSLSALLQQYKDADREFVQSVARTSSPGYPLVSLPDECDQVHAVIWKRGERDYVLLDLASPDDLPVQVQSGQGWLAFGMAPHYRLEGETIAFYPTSELAEDLLIYYTTHVGTGSGTFNARLDFDRWVTLDVCANVQTSRSKNAAPFLAERDMLGDQLLARARQREPHARPTIRDVRAADIGNWSRGAWWRL